jgi:hypothetical protein
MTTETVYVNAINDVKTPRWNEVGSAPYLDAGTTSYIWTDGAYYLSGNYSFPTSAGWGTINSVKLRFTDRIVNAAGNDYVEVYVWDGTSWYLVSGVLAPTWIAYQYDTDLDVTSILNTWAKINAAEFYLEFLRTDPYGIYIAEGLRVIDYTKGPVFFVETLLIQDVNTREAVYKRKLIDSTIVQDGFLRSKGFIRSFKENLYSIQDKLSRRRMLYHRAIPETLPITDINTRKVVYKRKFVDSTIIKDAVSRVRGKSRSFVENLSVIQDKFSRKLQYSRAIPETLPISDVNTRKAIYKRKITDSTLIRDTLSRVRGLSRSLIETLPISDVFSYVYTPYKVIHHYTRSFVENLSSIQDAFSYVYTPFKVIHHYSRSFTENLSVIQDVFSRRIAYQRKLIESVPIQDVFARTLHYSRSFIENLSAFKDAISRKVSYSRQMIENLPFRDVFSRAIYYSRSFVESIPVKDVMKRTIAYHRAFMENLPIRDTVKRTIAYYRSLMEQIIISDVFRRVMKYSRSFIENLSKIQDVLTRQIKYSRLMTEITVIQDAFAAVYVKAKKWLAYLSKKIRLRIEKPSKQAEFKT